MTLKLKTLAALAHNFAARNQAIDERIDALILRGSFASSDEQSAWLRFCADAPAPFRSVQVYDPAISGDLDPEEQHESDRVVIITVVKPALTDTAVFLFTQSTEKFLGGELSTRRVMSAEMSARSSFQARGLEVVPWEIEREYAPPAEPLSISPRKLVKDYVPNREIVDDLSPWLISTRPEVESREFLAWQAQAARRLLGALVNVASVIDGRTWLQASGPPSFRIAADDGSIAAAWEQLTSAAEWVFVSGSDIEARHVIFATELARANRADLSLSALTESALDGARATYEAHVQSTSRETLKALGDLRKTVIDETQKVIQRTQDLTANLWRDLAVSSTPFFLKIFGDAGKTTDPALASGFYFAAAAFIAFSFLLQTRINSAFLESQKLSREKWFETLYGHISSTERRQIAEDPIEAATSNYRETRNIICILYAILIIVLVCFGSATLNDAAGESRGESSTGMGVSAVTSTCTQWCALENTILRSK